jgi:hypothetical protein
MEDLRKIFNQYRKSTENCFLVIGASKVYKPDSSRWNIIGENWMGISHEPDNLFWKELGVTSDWSDADNLNDFMEYFKFN